MAEIFENDNELKALIRKEGLLATSPGFTLRVMQMVEESEKKAVYAYKPLLNRTAWILIIAFMTMLLIVCGWAVSGDNPEKPVYAEAVKPVMDLLENLNFSFQFNTSGLLIATIAIACMGVLLSLDILFSSKNNQVTA